jgi:hypothetical protein
MKLGHLQRNGWKIMLGEKAKFRKANIACFHSYMEFKYKNNSTITISIPMATIIW